MIDEKKIGEAARSYSKVTDCTKEEALLVEEGFNEGAHWAIDEFLKGLWHDAKEEPEDGATVLIIGKEGNATTYLIDSGYPDWNDEVKMWKITQWVYLDDLLPKKGGEK